MIIVKTIAEAAKYLPSVNITYDNTILNDALIVAQETIVREIIGSYIDDSIDSVLHDKTARAISLLAFTNSIGELDISLSDAGFVVAENEAVTPASKARIDKLVSSLHVRLSESIDALVEELSKDDYKKWRGTSQAGYIFSALISSRAEFMKQLIKTPKINLELVPSSWREFYEFIPSLQYALNSYVANTISADFINELCSKVRLGETLLSEEVIVYNWICKSIVAYALGDKATATIYTNKAYDYMVEHTSLFPSFEINIVQTTRINDKIQNFL